MKTCTSAGRQHRHAHGSPGLILGLAVMAVLTLALTLLGFRLAPGRMAAELAASLAGIGFGLPFMAVGILAASCLAALLPPARIAAWIGRKSGARGIGIAGLAGILVPSEPVMGLPLVAGFAGAGASAGAVLAFMGSWKLLSLMRLPDLLGIMGLRTTLIYLISTLAFPGLIGLAVHTLLPGLRLDRPQVPRSPDTRTTPRSATMKKILLREFNAKAASAAARSQEILDCLKPFRGSTVVDIGSGGGYFAVRFAHLVGPDGRVIAVDTEAGNLEFVGEYARAQGAGNLQTRLAPAEGPELAPASVDLVFARNVYHHLENPVEYFGKLRHSLRPGARVAIIDYRPRRTLSFIGLFRHHVPEEKIVSDLAKAGFERRESLECLDGQSFNLFAAIGDGGRA